MNRVPFWTLLVVAGCDKTGNELRPQVSEYPGIVDLGELRVLTPEEYNDPGFDPTAVPDAIYYGNLGALENPGQTGGATFSFRGTGGRVCVVVDPESMFWVNAIGLDSTRQAYGYVDNYQDDADLDLAVGLTAYYTGSPGVEIGDFVATYTDASGVDHELEFNECVQEGYGGTPDVHSGRATVESCNIATAQREGILFTALAKTFALPIDDSIASYAVGVFALEGNDKCSDLGISECTFPDEMTGGVPSDYSELEGAFCVGPGKVNDFCEQHVADEDVPPEERLCNVPE